MMHILIKQFKNPLLRKAGVGGEGARRSSAWRERVPQGAPGEQVAGGGSGQRCSVPAHQPHHRPVPTTSLAEWKLAQPPRVAGDPMAIG